jgi:heptosyltransferase-1
MKGKFDKTNVMESLPLAPGSRHPDPTLSDPSRVLILKPSSLGDIIHALPLLHLLRARFPKAHLSWLVKSEWAPLLQGHPELDEVIPVRFRFGEVGELLRAVRQDFDWVIDLQGLLRTGILARLSGAPVRIGLSDAREGAGAFYTHRAQVPDAPLHAVERYLLACRFFDRPAPERLFVLPDLSEADRSLKNVIQSKEIPGDRPWVAFHATARQAPKRWPAERFSALAERLIRERRAAVLFVGSRGERAEIEETVRRIAEPVYNLAGETGLLQLAALLGRVRLLVCNDSGPMHLAAALGTPVVALFGPTDPRKVGPYGKGHTVFKIGHDCSPCSRSRCVQGGACLKAIPVEEVAEAAVSFLEVRGKDL